MKKKNIRMIIDISMTVLLPLLMAYSLIGEKFHEIIGALMFGLLFAHNIIYVAIMILFMTIGCLFVYGLGKTTTERKAEKK